MAINNPGNVVLTQVDASPAHVLGTVVDIEGSEGTKKYKYVKTFPGAGSVTFHAKQVLVPYSNSTTDNFFDLNYYTADQTDTIGSVCRFAGVAVAANGSSTAARYQWLQIGGNAEMEQGTTTNRATYGVSLIAGLTDAQARSYPSQTAATDGDALLLEIQYAERVFAVATSSGSATSTTFSQPIFLLGLGS